MKSENLITVFYFHSDNCAACGPLLKIVERVSENYYQQLGNTVLFPVMDDENEDTMLLMSQYGLSNIPSFAFIEASSGNVLRTIDAADWATESTLMDTLSELGYPIGKVGIGVDVIKRLKEFSWVLASLIIIGLAVLAWFWFTRKKKK